MKKFLLTTVAAFIVAMGANAQFARVAQDATKMDIPTGVKMVKVETAKANIPVVAKKASARRATTIAGTYILNAGNWYGDFTECTEFTIEEATGTTKVCEFTDGGELSFDRDFEYNVKLTDFTYTNSVAYGKYYAEDGILQVPMQAIAANNTYGRIVMSGSVRSDNGGVNYGSDIVLVENEDGAFDFDEDYAAGWFSFLPEYAAQPNATWNYGFDCETYAPNGVQEGTEVHIQNGSWGNWTKTTHSVYVEDLGSEVVVHNFFGLCPISISIDGNKATIACPVRVQEYDYAEDGAEEPDYIQIWQHDENLEGILNPGAITGTVSEKDGVKSIEFYDVVYKDAWTDEQGEHEAGYYYVNDYTKWFMVHSTWGDNGAYWWGEARYVSVSWLTNASGINEAKANAQSTSKTYNLMGQQVNGDAKGLIIRDGKKLMNK